MKRLLLLLTFCLGALAFSSHKASAQTDVSIVAYNDSTYQWNCPVAPAGWSFYLWVNASGYGSQDSVLLEIFFGDGQDSSIKVSASYIQQQGGYFWYANHIYQNSGSFSLKYRITGPDGKRDSVVLNSQINVAVSCGNIEGMVYEDVNSNCTKDAGENELKWIIVNLYKNSILLASTYTDADGEYAFNVPTGSTYTVSLSANNSWGYSTTCPSSGSYTVSSFPATGKDFATECDNIPDLATNVSAWAFRPGVTSSFWVSYYNNSCYDASGTVTLQLDSRLSYSSADPAPDNVSGNTLTWNFSNLNNGDFSQNILVEVNPATSLQIGDTIFLYDSISVISSENNTANNVDSKWVRVRNSYDPNEKQVSPAGNGAWGEIPPSTPYLTYTVFFQNTGNDTAYDIFIIDTLDADLRAESFQILGSSHPVTYRVDNGSTVRFDFKGIYLVDSTTDEPGSHGSVTYRIALKSGLPLGREITNTAHIFFDFNPAIVTNTTLNMLVDPSGIGGINSTPFQVWPNPATAQVHIRLKNQDEFRHLRIVDMTGKIMLNKTIGSDHETIDVSSFSEGMYLIILEGDQGSRQQRLIVLH